MRVLILGGTRFLGRHLTRAALKRGHRVTLFHRGRSSLAPLDGVEPLHGDRTQDLSVLCGRRWDAVFDTCGYTPATVRRSAELLAGAVRHYTFVSSISVYEDHPLSGSDESAPLRSLTAEELEKAEKIDPGHRATAASYGPLYGGLKACCEEAAESAMPGRVLRVRPGLIVGPWDYSDRFTYWVRRIAKGGEVLAPGSPERRIRVIDARDLARWVVRMAEAGRSGVYNATGPVRGSTFGELLHLSRKEARSEATLTWVDEAFLLEQEVGPWMELPLWMPEEYNGVFEISNDAAVAAGLTFRPLAETIRDTLEWDLSSSWQPEWKTGLDPAREAELLKIWSDRR